MKAWSEVPFAPPQAPAPSRLPEVAHANGKAQAETTVFIALPTYNGWVKAQAIEGLILASDSVRAKVVPGFGSLLAMNFNHLICTALNTRAQVPWTHWALHHADIAAPPGWLDVMLAEQSRLGADVLSVVSPIKDDRGLTSTGVIQADGSIRRLTLKEIGRLPETFSGADLAAIGITLPLVVNTGLMLIRFDESWAEEMFFNVGDRIRKEPDGSFRPLVLPEDWQFSDWCNHRGLKVFCTRKVAISHYGESEYRNDNFADGWETDLGDG